MGVIGIKVAQRVTIVLPFPLTYCHQLMAVSGVSYGAEMGQQAWA